MRWRRYCPRIGVQGAGLVWFRFLPRDGALLEITYRGWKSKYVGRAHQWRPDIRALSLRCKVQTPNDVYRQYAGKLLRTWIRKGQEVNATMRRRIAEASAKVNPVRGNIYKDSDVLCNIEDVLNALKTLRVGNLI